MEHTKQSHGYPGHKVKLQPGFPQESSVSSIKQIPCQQELGFLLQRYVSFHISHAPSQKTSLTGLQQSGRVNQIAFQMLDIWVGGKLDLI